MKTSDDRVEQEIAAPLRELNATLDEVHRARLGAAVETALDRAEPVHRAPRRFPRRAGLVVAVATAAAAAWTAVTWTRAPGTPAPVPAPSLAAAPRPAVPPLLVPIHSAGGTPTPSTSLLAMAGQRVRATIGARVRLTLVGPGRLSVVAAERDGDLELALDGGRLLADYDGRAGGTLRVRSPGAETTIVGTLFAVDVTPFGSRVAVAHGRVRTRAASGQVQQVAAGSVWSSADDRVSPISSDLAGALRQHEADWAGGVQAPVIEPPKRPVRAPHATVPPPVDLDALYARAEAAMRRRATGEARRALETIAGRDPSGPLGEMALLDLARLALADGDRAAARQALGRLPASLHDSALNETADHLKCRAAAAGDAAGPPDCRAVP